MVLKSSDVTLLIVELVPAPDHVPTSGVPDADDGPVSVASSDISPDEVISSDSRHDTVPAFELVAPVVSIPVPGSVPGGGEKRRCGGKRGTMKKKRKKEGLPSS